jgi:hypothetical protein
MATSFLATTEQQGKLNPIPHCWIYLGNLTEFQISDAADGSENDPNFVRLYALPELQDGKSVQYADQTIQGRAAPVKTYSYSSDRNIGLTLHLYVTQSSDITRNLDIIRRIASLAHPEYNNTYLPPKIARMRCGKLLSEDAWGIPVLLTSYNVSYDTDIQWFYDEDTQTYMPLHVSISTEWSVIYSWTSLPGSADVLQGNY